MVVQVVHVDRGAGATAGTVADGDVTVVQGAAVGSLALGFGSAFASGFFGVVYRAGVAHEARFPLAAGLTGFSESLREGVVVDLQLGDTIVL